MPKTKTVIFPKELERLTELVRGHPCLYNARLPDHKDAQLCTNILQSIATVMGRDDLGGEFPEACYTSISIAYAYSYME